MAKESLGEKLLLELATPGNPSTQGLTRFSLDSNSDLNSARISAKNGDFDLTDFFLGELLRGLGDIPDDNLVLGATGLRLLALSQRKRKYPEMTEVLDRKIQGIITTYLRPSLPAPLSDP